MQVVCQLCMGLLWLNGCPVVLVCICLQEPKDTDTGALICMPILDTSAAEEAAPEIDELETMTAHSSRDDGTATQVIKEAKVCYKPNMSF